MEILKLKNTITKKRKKTINGYSREERKKNQLIQDRSIQITQYEQDRLEEEKID